MRRLHYLNNKADPRCTCGLRIGFPAGCLLGSRIRIPPRTWTFVSCAFRLVYKIAKRWLLASLYLSVRPRGTTGPPTGWIFMEFGRPTWKFFVNISWKFKLHYRLTRISSILHEDLCTFLSLPVLLKMRNVSDKSCGENQNPHIVLSKPPTPENLTVYEITPKNTVQPDGPQMTIYYDAWPLPAGELRLQIDTQNM